MKVNQKNLAGVIEIKDVHQLPTGFKAKYMAWAKVAAIFNKECPGWSHHCRLNPQDGHPLFDAPNGSLYFIFYFKVTEGNEYSDFIFPIMGNNKKALKRELVDAREISDTQRRGFVAHCAFQFSLGYELWAKEEIDDNKPHLQIVKNEEKPAQYKKVDKPKYDKNSLVDMIMNELNVKMTNDEQKKLWVIAKAKEYKIEGGGSKLQQMTVLQLRNCLQELENGRF